MGRPRKFDDDMVLDRATELFWRYGVDAVSIRDLEVGLDLKAPSIYRRFESKEQLLVRCLDRYVDQTVGGRVRRFLDDDDPLRGLRAFFASVLRPHAGEQHPRGCLLTTTAGHAEATTPDIRAALDRGFGTIEAAFRRQLERAKAAGQVDACTDTESVAKALLMSLQGLLVLARSGAGDLQAGIEATMRAVGSNGTLRGRQVNLVRA